jgi:hypothetical protein
LPQYSSATTLSGSFGVPGDIPVVGDWNGNGITKVGVFRPSEGRWYLDVSGKPQYSAATTQEWQFGAPGDIPVVGDWNGEGRTRIGVFRPSLGKWFLELSGVGGQYNAATTQEWQFGAPGDIPVVGDWNGEGRTRIGVFRPSLGQWFLDISGTGGQYNSSTTLEGQFGARGDVPVVGDWTGNGVTKVGVFRPSESKWYLDLTGTAQYSAATTLTGSCGISSDIPIIGRWR